MARGGIILLIILTFFSGGIILVFKFTNDSLPGDLFYSLKGIKENLQLVTTELNNVSRASMYISLTNKRLDELEKLEKKGVSSEKLVGVLEESWKNEQLAFTELTRAKTRLENIVKISEEMKELDKKQQMIFKRLMEKIPAPYFYTILEISNQAKKTINMI